MKIKEDALFYLLAAGAALVTLCGFLGRLFWVFDLFSHFRVQIFQICLVLIGLALWRRKNRVLILFVILAVLNYAFVFPFYFGKPGPAEKSTARAMLMNLNASNGNAEEVLAFIEQTKPDLLVLEEVTPKWIHELEPLNSVFPYQVARPRTDCFGIMLLSRFPLSHTNIVEVGSAGVPTIVATVHFPQGEVSVIGTHPLPPLGAEYSAQRNSQLEALPELVLKQKNPVLLIGDLNTSPWSPYFTKLLKASGLKNSMKGFGFQPSWPTGNRLLRIPIDQVLYSPEITIYNRRVGSDIGSDHFPVWVDFSL